VPAAHEEPAAKTASVDVPTPAARVTAAQRANRQRLQKPASRTRPGPKAMTLGPRKVKAETVDVDDIDLLEDDSDESKLKSAESESIDKARASPESGDPLDPEIFNRRFADQQ
jgi:hypothetical protein